MDFNVLGAPKAGRRKTRHKVDFRASGALYSERHVNRTGRTPAGTPTIGSHRVYHNVNGLKAAGIGVGVGAAAYGGYRLAKHFHDSHQQHQDPRNGIKLRHI